MGISINLGSSGRSRRWRIDLSSPPVEAHQTGSRFGALFLILFALVWGGFPTVGLFSLIRSGDMGAEAFLFLLFPAIGLGILAFGIRNLVWRRSVSFDGRNFSVTERGLLGGKSWTEPLSGYDGVLRKTKRVKTKNSSYTLYMVDLIHPDPDRRINLYTDTSSGEFRAKWEEYARQLNLPAFEEGDGVAVRREAADLDKSVGELLREGKMEVDYDALTRSAEGLATDFEGDWLVITRTTPQNPWWGSLLAVLFPLIFVGAGLFAPGMDMFGRAMFVGVGSLFEIILVAGVYNDLTSRARLRVGPEGVRVNKVRSSGENEGKFIPVQELETVVVSKKDNEWQGSLVIASDRETLRFGAGLPRTSLDFVANTILAKIADAERRGRRR
jgi:hypothetical protein